MDKCEEIDIEKTNETEPRDEENIIPAFRTIRNVTSTFANQKRFDIIEKLLKNCLGTDDFNYFKSLDKSNFEKNKDFRKGIKEEVLLKLHLKFYNELVKNEDKSKNDLIFFAASSFQLDKLQALINEKVTVNQTRYEDSVLMFVLKYGNYNSARFMECMQILIEGGADINRGDLKGRTPIDYLVGCYKREEHNTDIVNKLVQLFLEHNPYIDEPVKAYLQAEEYTIQDSTVIDIYTQIHLLVVRNNLQELKKIKDLKGFINRKDCENTLMQLACRKNDKFLDTVKFLLEKGADPNQVTEWNKLSPLELAVNHKNLQIIKVLLQNEDTNITKKAYSKLIEQGLATKSKKFEMTVNVLQALVKCKRLDPRFESEKTKNTPLHCALMFDFKGAIQTLLGRGSSVCARNAAGTSCLELMAREYFNEHFDNCMKYEGKNFLTSSDYKVTLNFHTLIEKESELQVVHEIGKSEKLQGLLLQHPLLYTFLSLKWQKSKFYFYSLLLAQFLVYMLLSICFYYYNHLSWIGKSFCSLLMVLNLVKVVVCFMFSHSKKSFHNIVEILLGICTILIIIPWPYHNSFRPFIFVLMSISILLISGYHPKLSKWSIMLQTVLKKFVMLSLFLSLLIFAFGAGFHVLVENVGGDSSFKNFATSIFEVYMMMSTSDLKTEDAKLEIVGLNSYLLFILFATIMSLMVVNFWTGVAVTDIERIEKDSEINSIRNVIIFLRFIDKFFIKMTTYVSGLIRLPQTLLFVKAENKNNKNGDYFYVKVNSTDGKNVEKKNRFYCVNFYINREIQFGSGSYPNLPKKVDPRCIKMMYQHYYRTKKAKEDVTIKELLKRLDQASAKGKREPTNQTTNN